MVFFTECFDVSTSVMEEYGAFNISLVNDLPVFIDPFLLYGSKKPDYIKLHDAIISYLFFLREKSQRGNITDLEVEAWYTFSEVKQNWLGFSVSGNGGSGLGSTFGNAMSKGMHIIFSDLKKEEISKTSHLEKATLFQMGIGKDNVSDFTCNLIKSFLLSYTEAFAQKYLKPNQVRKCNVEKAYFNYEIERWMASEYILPIYNNDYVILTPRDILTKDDNWINSHDLRGDFIGICKSINNDRLRNEIDVFYKSKLPAPTYVGKGKNQKLKKITARDKSIAVNATINKFPSIIDYYIKQKEENKDGAKSEADKKVQEIELIFQSNVKQLRHILYTLTNFYDKDQKNSYREALERIQFLKDVIENKDGYKLFYYKGEPIKRESDLQVIYRLTWFASPLDVNKEVNNGRGPVDYSISNGATDKTNVEFKLASNSKLKMNLQNQTQIYEKAGNVKKTIKVILYFDSGEFNKTITILKELRLDGDESIILIDAGKNKPSASNVK